MTVIGAHLHEGDPLEQAQALGADIVQFFLGDPQGWKAPVFPGEPAEVRTSFEAAGVGAYIHAPYVINVASYKNGVGYSKWTHIDGWSDSVVEYIRTLESPANGWVN